MSPENNPAPGFGAFGLSEPVLKALDEVGYESPSPIQTQTIPPLLAGRDVVGQAQTGSGKTAAFALPLLSRLALDRPGPLALALTPTRELALQVAEAFRRYAAYLKGFRVTPIYGGQDYGVQLRQLRHGPHVVVGTPGRVMDHMRRGALDLGQLEYLVLDEADEMLRMGFLEDVTWILEQTPTSRQTALFSATMPDAIRRIAEERLREPAHIAVKMSGDAAAAIRQRFWVVSGYHKLDALTRILEAEPFEAMIIFTRTKTMTTQLAEKLEARGFAAVALNGDMAQAQRERTVARLKAGAIDILIATDVAARGLDIDRVSHVVNYDIPYDAEAYIHRIGRTGRAGRSGEAILFVEPREKRLLFAIERAAKQRIQRMQLPSAEVVNDKRIARFKQRITETLAAGELDLFRRLIEQYQQEHNAPSVDVAAALAKLLQGDAPLLVEDVPVKRAPRDRADRPARPRTGKAKLKLTGRMVRFRVEVGHAHGVRPGNIVGAIANEAGIESASIGRIDIQRDHSLVDLPEDLPADTLRFLKRVFVSGRPLMIAKAEAGSSEPTRETKRGKPARTLRQTHRKTSK